MKEFHAIGYWWKWSASQFSGLKKKQPLNILTRSSSFHLQNTENSIIVGSGSFQFSHYFNTIFFRNTKKNIHQCFPLYSLADNSKTGFSISKAYPVFHEKNLSIVLIFFSIRSSIFRLFNRFAYFFHSQISIIFICFLFPLYIFHSSVFVKNIQKFI